MQQDNLVWTAGGAIAGLVLLLIVGIIIDLFPIILGILGLIIGGVSGLSMAPSNTGGQTDAEFG